MQLRAQLTEDFLGRMASLMLALTGNISPTSQTSPNVQGVGFRKTFGGGQKKVTRGMHCSPAEVF